MEWISVECELPEEHDAYFVTWISDTCIPFIGICIYDPDDENWLVEEMPQAKYYHYIKIIAWMDAKPYKED